MVIGLKSKLKRVIANSMVLMIFCFMLCNDSSYASAKGKSFTALSIMQLIEEGLLGLDSPISEYIDASEWFCYTVD